ncbi:MAG: DNA repair protein radA [candidate division TA06 bacterium 32_111]|uniref:DNA repair protein RadA n=1 Tax=candidate division TA06 bacterium 34_109 TaxID=1635277 RepID=A0A101I1F5_UNCT6|nr:MAG: DNA repair protein radA [candidate division TA06 bacterium 32_111]KUK86719.1 MAG: DNA repair protein radA [candidate division TA06 bacterium 34_109]
MSKKEKKSFVCSECGFKSVKWLGRCPECGMWDTFILEKEEEKRPDAVKPISVEEIKLNNFSRIKFFDNSLNRIFGGGLVKGSLVLLAGNPGAGKSTLSLKIIEKLPDDVNVLYFSSEESFEQIKMRTVRVLKNKNFKIISSNLFEDLVSDEKLLDSSDLIIIDSIQMVGSERIPTIPGSPTTVKYIMGELIRIAKKKNISVIIIGHITKDGSVAGPKTLEHLVDVILYLDTLQNENLRVLKSNKNRFGSTDEMAIFKMNEEGLQSVENIDKLNLSDSDRVGRAISCTVEGSMPIALEIESLIFYSKYGVPQRVPTGINIRRMQMLVGICEKYLGVGFGNMDIFINVSNGIFIKDPQIDLPVIVSMLSSFKNKIVSKESAFVGEVGLTGDLRASGNLDLRIKHLANIGIRKVYIPAVEKIKTNIEVVMIKNIKQIKEIV